MAETPGGSGRSLPLLSAAFCGNGLRGGLTDREVRLLHEMRRLKERLPGTAPEDRQELLHRLALLQREREEARRERMSLLGHEG
ncbi:MAG: hypothetical protein ACP5VN_04745 [Acidobacteriota bacterium]